MNLRAFILFAIKKSRKGLTLNRDISNRSFLFVNDSLMKMKILLLCLLVPHLLWPQGFLRTNGADIVNGKGEKIILRGMGLGVWMLQEGDMLRVGGIGQQQHVIRANI